ncbi:MAG: phosphatidylinositol phosphate synthase [Streptosporangiaceae bacterium]
MLNLHVRPALARVLTPIGRGLARTGISPDAITLVGTLGVVVGAFIFYPRGQLFVGTLVITAFVFSDMLDGALARARGRSSQWGAFLDSTLDRIADASIFGALVLWFADGGDAPMLAALALFCLIAGVVVSYAKARAEGVGLSCDVGIAERPERLIVVLASTGLGGLGVPYALTVGLWVLAVASAVTLAQRVLEVRRQTREPDGSAEEPRPKAGHRP